jgi:hypothetical protein
MDVSRTEAFKYRIEREFAIPVELGSSLAGNACTPTTLLGVEAPSGDCRHVWRYSSMNHGDEDRSSPVAGMPEA